jgi:7,8-dihydro-6-hydroxymethylpterin-pyrophosphokinase
MENKEAKQGKKRNERNGKKLIDFDLRIVSFLNLKCILH